MNKLLIIKIILLFSFVTGSTTTFATANNRSKINANLISENASSATSLKVMSYNVLYGFNHGKKIELGSNWINAQQPDFVALQEMKGFNQARFSKQAKTWGHEHSYLYKGKKGLPLAFSSRFAINSITPLEAPTGRIFLSVESKGIHFIVVHLTSQKLSARKQETAFISEHINKLLLEGKKLVVLGDFNAMSTKDNKRLASMDVLLTEMREIVKKRKNLNNNQFDTSILQSYYDLGLHDSTYHHLSGTDKSDKLIGSFPSLAAKKATSRKVQQHRLIRIDYILTSKNLVKNIVNADILNWTDTAQGKESVLDEISDHYPLVLELAQ